MPITVSCPACRSRFSLSDDLYRRRVAGSLVKVKCRNCNAEIAVDATATEPVTMPSHEAPRKHPSPPRPKMATVMGLGPMQPTQPALATSSPLPLNATRTPLPLNPTVTPLPIHPPKATPLAGSEADLNWGDDEQTIAINVSKTKAPPKPHARTLPIVPEPEEDEPELVEAEEIPLSSSGAPTLEALTLKATNAQLTHEGPHSEDFLVDSHPFRDESLGAPTIDVTSFAVETTEAPLSVDVVEEPPELEYRPARAENTGTMPLFDMSAVLPPGRPQAAAPVAVPARGIPRVERVEVEKAAADAPASEGRSRERKFVVAPQAAEPALDAPRSRRSGVVLWVGLLAAAAAIVGVVGSRAGRWTQPLSAEPPHAAEATPTAVANTQAAVPAEQSPEPSAAPETSPPPETNAAASVNPQNVPAGSTRSTVATTAAVKSSESAASTHAPSSEAEKPSSASAPPVEKPIVAAKPEVHNAPPPAEPGTEFDRAAARDALASAAAQASSCRKEGDPSGTANLTITFAPSGRVTSAQIQGPPFSGTATGGCIASTMRRANVPAFSGEHVTVSKTIVVQ